MGDPPKNSQISYISSPELSLLSLNDVGLKIKLIWSFLKESCMELAAVGASIGSGSPEAKGGVLLRIFEMS